MKDLGGMEALAIGTEVKRLRVNLHCSGKLEFGCWSELVRAEHWAIDK